MLYLLYLVGVMLMPGAFPAGCGQAEQPAPPSPTAAAEGGDFAFVPPGSQLDPGLSPSEPNVEPAPASGGEAPAAGANGAQDTAVSMDPPDEDELPDDGNAPVLSSWVANLPDGSTAPENMILRTPLNLVAGDAGNEEDVRLRWSVESANQLAFMIQRQQWWGEQWIDSDLIVAPPFPYTYTDSPGAGLWRYAIAAANTEGISPPSDWSEVRVDSSWTTFTPSADTRIVYVSSSEGNDSNDGLSTLTPKATIAAGYALLRNGYPDWLLLKRGDVWDESFPNFYKSGRSVNEPLVANTYGDDAARPHIRSGTQGGISRWGAGRTDYVALVGLHFTPHLRTTSDSPSGFRWLDSGRHILLEDCKFDGYKDNIAIQGFTGLVEDFVLRRCISVNSWGVNEHSQGLYASKVAGLTIDNCVFDHNGWREGVADPTIFNHNIYVQVDCSDVVLVNTISARASSHGAQVRPGGRVVNNLFIGNPIALLVGTGGVDGGGTDPTSPVIAHATHNVIVEGRNLSDASPRGFGLEVLFASSGLLSYNIIKDLGNATNPRAINLDGSQGGGNHNVLISDNAIYNWQGPIILSGTAQKLSGIVLERNLVRSSASIGPLVNIGDATNTGAVTSRNNRFWAPSVNASSLMRIGASSMDLQSWRSAVQDIGSTHSPSNSSDSAVSIGGYLTAALSMSGTSATFLDMTHQQSRRTWNPLLTAPEVNEYFRESFGYPEPPTP